MNAIAFREWAKKEHDRAVAEARLILEIRLDTAKRLERGEKPSGASGKRATKSEPAIPSPQTLDPQDNGEEEDNATGVTLREAVQSVLAARVGEKFRISQLKVWVQEQHPGVSTDRPAIHRVLNKLKKKNSVRVVNPDAKGNEGFLFEVLDTIKAT